MMHPSPRRPWAAAGLLLAVLVAQAAAQEEPAPGPAAPPAPEEPAPTDLDSEPDLDLDAALDGLDALHSAYASAPQPLRPTAPDLDRERERFRRETRAREQGLRELARVADAYVAAAGDAAEPRAHYFRGFGHLATADKSGGEEAARRRETAAEAFEAYLRSAPEGAAHRADAEFGLGRAYSLLGRVEESVKRFERAAAGFLEDGRSDDAGRAAYFALEQLLARGRESDARALAQRLGADEADFGASTEGVRRLARRSRVAVGSPLPPLPAVTDSEGREIDWSSFEGRPLLIHFFQAGLPTGHATVHRDVETDIRPLFERLAPGGLAVVGVSMDLELSEQRVREIRAQWEEWGTRGVVQTGSREAVAGWCESQGVAWPFTWDGKWTENPVSNALGGVGRSGPFAVLVDRAGVIRWRGEPPYTGLAEAAEELVRAK